jgi:hypothetical protein
MMAKRPQYYAKNLATVHFKNSITTKTISSFSVSCAQTKPFINTVSPFIYCNNQMQRELGKSCDYPKI